jgi:hypothetical protein
MLIECPPEVIDGKAKIDRVLQKFSPPFVILTDEGPRRTACRYLYRLLFLRRQALMVNCSLGISFAFYLG